MNAPGTFTTEAEGHVVVFTPTGTLATPFTAVSFNTSLQDTTGAALAYPWLERIAIRPAAPVAEVEPNDDGVAGITAADLTAAQLTGVGPGSGVFEIMSVVGAATDVDAYAFTAAVGDRIMATILNQRIALPPDGVIHVDVYNAAGNRLTEGRRSNFAGDAYVDHTFETAGTYYLVVTNPTVAAPPQTYHLLGVLD